MPNRLLLRLYQALGLIGDPGIRDPDHPPQRNASSPLPVFLRFVASRLRLFNPPPKAAQLAGAFRTELEQALGQLSGTVAEHTGFTLKAGEEQWLDTGLTLQAGESITLMADGCLYLSRPLDVAIGPGMGLWYRIGEADIHRMPAAAAVIRAQEAGRLQIIAAVPGGFADPQGNFDKALPSLPISGEFSVVAIRWQGDEATALQTAAAVNQELFGPLMERLQKPAQPPAGWHYLWRVGEGEIFRPHAEDGSLCCDTHGDGGILQYPVDLPLTDDLVLNWDWLVEQLPSRLPEHIQPTHDYLSLAIEFDNGLDLTYMWSSGMAVDTIFQCPLPWWDQRETHWVLRNNPAELGQWLSESRNVKADYQHAIGGALPERVVGVWLIANSAFQRGKGLCRYRAVSLHCGQTQQLIQA